MGLYVKDVQEATNFCVLGFISRSSAWRALSLSRVLEAELCCWRDELSFKLSHCFDCHDSEKAPPLREPPRVQLPADGSDKLLLFWNFLSRCSGYFTENVNQSIKGTKKDFSFNHFFFFLADDKMQETQLTNNTCLYLNKLQSLWFNLKQKYFHE